MKLLVILINVLTVVTACQASPNTEDGMLKIEEQNIIKAVENNNIKTVEEALKNGSNVNTVDKKKRSLLLIATNNAHTEMAQLLVKQGANVNQQAENMDTPFLYAGATGQTALVELYLNHGARFDIFNRYQGTALIPACERGHVETVRVLVNTENYPIDHVNRLGWTALMEAIVLGNGTAKYQQIVQILKDGGANMTIPDKDGISPLQHAERRGFKEIVSIIKS